MNGLYLTGTAALRAGLPGSSGLGTLAFAGTARYVLVKAYGLFAAEGSLFKSNAYGLLKIPSLSGLVGAARG